MSNRGLSEMTTTDGRTLCWAEFGHGAGTPIMFFHGGNDSRLAGKLLDAPAHRTAVRLICPERMPTTSADSPSRARIKSPDSIELGAHHLYETRGASLSRGNEASPVSRWGSRAAQ